MATTQRKPVDPHANKPVESVFDRVRADPKFNQRRSTEWFKKKISDLGGFGPAIKTELLAETRHLQTNFPLPGAMHFFAYDPKYKDELPYYDKFPLALIFSVENELMRGINFHYLSYRVRKILFDKLWQIASQYHNNRQQVQRLSWKLLGNVSKFPEVQPAVKSYLYTHLRSRLIKVPVQDWATAIYLPVETFAKKNQGAVASLSGMKIRDIMAGR